MITPKLTNFVISQRKLGIQESVLRDTLLKSGWNQTDIEAVLTSTTPEFVDSTPSINDSTNKHKSVISTALALCGLLGAILMIVFFAATFLSGKSLFKSEEISLVDSLPRAEKQLDLPKSGNPYRIIFTVRYKVLGEPFNSHYDLLKYTYNLVDSSGKSIYDGKKTITYSSSNADDDTSNLSRSSISASSEVMTFAVPADGLYTFSMPIEPNPDIGGDFQLENFSYEIKANVITLSPIILITGFGLLCVSAVGILVRSKKNQPVVN